jgi:transposase
MDTNILEAPGRRLRRRHSADFKTSIIRACQQPGVSMASVALANGLNATMVRKWVVEAEGGSSRPASVIATAAPSSPPTFVPLALPQQQDLRDIRIELQRGNVRITLHWPREGVADCASWMRELLR